MGSAIVLFSLLREQEPEKGLRSKSQNAMVSNRVLLFLVIYNAVEHQRTTIVFLQAVWATLPSAG